VLLRSLGFAIQPVDQVTALLRAGVNGKRAAIAVLLRPDESPDLGAARFSDLSPASYALTLADNEGVPYVIVAQGGKLRLYPTGLGVGVGRRGRTETFVEVHTGLLRDSDAAFLWLLFSADALLDGGSLSRLLDESRRFAGNLAERLRDRVYKGVVPSLAQGIADARKIKNPSPAELADTYAMAMTVLFRLLFVAYAEDKDLLPYLHNELYAARSLKKKAVELKDLWERKIEFDETTTLWREADALFDAVNSGSKEWGIPAYDGGLFARDPDVAPIGAKLSDIELSNRVFGPALRALICIETEDGSGIGPVDFRALGVREFGTIYEGLLESELSIAEEDVTVDDKGFYRPAKKGEATVAERGRVYLHNRSGARKSSGSYFTKSFAVEHLLDQALEPALSDHIARIEMLDDDAAGDALFDFRIADIAMGSGHFLVAAIDRIERSFGGYLAKRALPGVRAELARLREAANDALGPLKDQFDIEDNRLLRRLIARRCVYGVDSNRVAVDLSRVSIWIHTFVPGLPLSLLDRNLIVGNSLVGIGTVEEIVEFARGGDYPLFQLDAQALVGDATMPLKRLAMLADANATELKAGRAEMERAKKACAPAEALFDIITACRMNGEPLGVNLDDWDRIKTALPKSKGHAIALADLKGLQPIHFPVAFPEVFLRDRAGFDVILGNPPWQEATLEEHAFWARHWPGLRSLPQKDQEKLKAELRRKHRNLVEIYERELAEAEVTRKALTTGPYPGMGTGDPDLYKAFCWRFWNLIARDGGWTGVVLPRSAFNAKGSTEFRLAVIERSHPLDITMLLNTGGWVFDEAEHRYTIGLVGIRRRDPSGKSVRLRGPFANLKRFLSGRDQSPSEFAGKEILSWTDTASLPLLPTEESLSIFTQMRKAPRLDRDVIDEWRARPHTELHATNDKDLMDLRSATCPPGFWPVFKGESFDLWTPDTGKYYAFADPKKVVPHLHKKALTGVGQQRSVFSEFKGREGEMRDSTSLPCYRARVAFRDVSRATDSRTLRVALVPPRVFVTNKGPYFLWPRGDERDQAYLLGVLSSISLDWYARRFVEISVNFFVLNPFPIPRPPRKGRLWQRVVDLAGRLAARDDRFAEWASTVGVDHGPLDEAAKDDRIHELDAVIAHLYGLSEAQLSHIFETFHEGWAYETRLRATLKHYAEWKGKLR
jgi:hypothetical protein